MRLILITSNQRLLATDVRLNPGESREISNPWGGASPINLIVREGGELLPMGEELQLIYQAGHFPLAGERLTTAAVGLDGSWHSSLAMPHGTYRVQRPGVAWSSSLRVSGAWTSRQQATVRVTAPDPLLATRREIQWDPSLVARRHAHAEFVHNGNARVVTIDLRAQE